MRISKVTDEAIIFNNGNEITFDHEQDCWEENYADFTCLNKDVFNYNHDFPEHLEFKFADNAGFIFGEEEHWIFIPCYSDQNGYYTTNIDIDIYYNGVKVLSGLCMERTNL